MAAHRRSNRRRVYLCADVLPKGASLVSRLDSKQIVWRFTTTLLSVAAMPPAPRSVAIFVVGLASIALADDFKTNDGKEYKDATVSRVEADGLVVKTKGGISKLYFTELPKDVQERFHYDPANAAAAQSAAIQQTEEFNKRRSDAYEAQRKQQEGQQPKQSATPMQTDRLKKKNQRGRRRIAPVHSIL